MGAEVIAEAGEFEKFTELAPAKNWLRLLAIAMDAGAFYPPNYVASILGRLQDLHVPPSPWSEFTVLDRRKTRQLVRYLAAATFPALTVPAPGWALPPFDHLMWRPTRVYHFPDHVGNMHSCCREAWFFINGVATNYAVARLNAAYLAHLFHRPITMVHNSTASLGLDLAECAVGKGWKVMTEPARVAFPEIVRALNDKHVDRVVVVCHSQGTIIMSNVLRALADPAFRKELLAPVPVDERPRLRRDAALHKLEIYAFATCADVMQYAGWFKQHGRTQPAPWMEHFGNEHDLVARLGMLAPNKPIHDIEIQGPKYFRAGAWGHLLNEHYLGPVEKHLRDPGMVPNPYPLHPASSAHHPAESRLYRYYRGGHRSGNPEGR